MTRFVAFLRSSVRGRLVLLVLVITVPAMLLVLWVVFKGYRNERQAVV